MRDFRKQILALFVLLCAFASFAAQQTAYTVTDLGGLSGGNSTKATAINNSGQIVGMSANHAFLWQNGVMTDLGTLGGNFSVAHAINDLGQVVGDASTPGEEIHAFLWENGVMKDLGIPGETSSARGININGDVVGASFAKNVRGGALLWKAGNRQSLGDLGPSGSGSTAISINDKGEVVGVSSGFASSQGVVRAVFWQSGVIHDIGTLGGLHSTANALNNLGAVVGWTEIGDASTVAFLWQGGVMLDLGSLPGSAIMPGAGSQAAAVNESGQVVGSSLNSKGEMRAVTWENGKITDLNGLIPRTSGLVFNRATAINNQGQIVVEQQARADGPARAFLLTLRHR